MEEVTPTIAQPAAIAIIGCWCVAFGTGVTINMKLYRTPPPMDLDPSTSMDLDPSTSLNLGTCICAARSEH